MLFVHPYERGDAFKVKIRNGDVWDHVHENLIKPETTYKLVDEHGNVYLVAGIEVVYRGVGTALSYISNDCKGKAIEVIRIARMMYPKLMKELGLHRVQCTVDPKKKGYEKFAKAIGFEFESRIRKGAPNGDDLCMYAMVR